MATKIDIKKGGFDFDNYNRYINIYAMEVLPGNSVLI